MQKQGFLVKLENVWKTSYLKSAVVEVVSKSMYRIHLRVAEDRQGFQLYLILWCEKI